jgi:hypothetical protein
MRMRLLSVGMLATLVFFSIPLSAANAYADPAFQAQWQAGEAIIPNFWGPLANAKDGQQEPYKEATGGNRLVQYFDKGRMELTNGTVTNGLLASELVRGRVQTGNNTFEDRPQPAIPVAGDPDGGGVMYAQLAGDFKDFLAPYQSHVGGFINLGRSGGGRLTYINAQGLDSTNMDPSKLPNGLSNALTSYDSATQHNLFGPFAEYRDRVGLAAIGLAISEPFYCQVTVAGRQGWLAIQVFERRLLTFNPSNAQAFQVEMGNIGQHYYQWRYPTGTPTTTSPTTTAPAALSLSVAPASAPLGSTFQVTGAGLPPNTSYVLLVVRSDGALWSAGDVMTSATGTLAASIDTSAVPKLTSGDYTAQLQVQRAPTRVGVAAFTIT